MLERTYDNLYRIWLQDGGAKPIPSTADQMRISYSGTLNSLKSLSDQIIYHPVKYKILFGTNAEEELQATFKVVKIGKNCNADDVLKHDMYDKNLAMLLSEITYIPHLPVPIGILYKENKPTYEQMMTEQIQEAIDLKGKGDLNKLII